MEKLVFELGILWRLEWWKMDARATLYDWLALTIDWKMRVMTIVSSKLANSCHNYHVFATTHKYAALYGSCKNETIFTVVNVNVSSNIKNEIRSIIAIFDIKLLPFYRVHSFYSELIFLLFEIIILWIKFFFLYCWV